MKQEKRSDKVTVMMPSDPMPGEEPQAVVPLDQFIDDPDAIKLSLKRTKEYVKEMLDRPVGEVWKEVNDQMTILILSLREAQMKWLELWTNSQNPRMREEAKHHFIALSREAAALAEQRQVIARAIGINISGDLGEAEREKLPSLYEPKPMTTEDFEKQFMPLIPKPVIADLRLVPEVSPEKK